MGARVLRVFVLLIVTGVCASWAGVDLTTAAWRDDLKTANGWTRQPSWLPNPSDTAKVTTDGEVASFAVDEPGKGMKWSRALRQVWLPEARFVVLRYRAEHFNTASGGYFLYLADGGSQECHALRTSDVVADGQWHTVAVDALSVAEGDSVDAVALQVQATAEGKARVWVDFMEFVPTVPEGAAEISRSAQAPPKPDWVADMKTSTWQFHKDWLGNPADRFETRRTEEGVLFRVDDSSRGMKWSWDLPSPAATEGHRFLMMRYRALNTRPVMDYALAVIGTPRGNGMDYTSAIPPGAIVADGRWHAATVELQEIAARFKSVGALAVQVQAGDKAPAEITVAEVAFVNQAPQPKVAEYVDIQPGARFDDFRPVDIGAQCNDSFARFLECLRLKGWPGGELLTVQGIPYQLSTGAQNAACSGMSAEGEITLPLDVAASEVYLLLTALFRGKDDPVRGEGKLSALRDVDRFRVRLTYADGSSEECLPVNVGLRRFEVAMGPQVLCAFADAKKRLKSVQVKDSTPQGAFAVTGVTNRIRGQSTLKEFREDWSPLRPLLVKKTGAVAPTVVVQAGKTRFENREFVVTLRLEPLAIADIENRSTGHHIGPGDKALPLCALKVGNKQVDPSAFKLRGQPTATRDGGEQKVDLHYEIASLPGLEVNASLSLPPSGEMRMSLSVKNNGSEPVDLELAGPRVGPVRLGARLEDDYYLFPKRGAVFDNSLTNLRTRYCGLFPVQVMSAFSPGFGDGIYLRTEDLDGVDRQYALSKSEDGVTLGVEYPNRSLPPGETQTAVVTRMGVSSGDWREPITAYRNWVKTWYKPASPRQQWFREVFNFRQRFLHWLDPLYDGTSGSFGLERAVAEAKEKFGGIDYLHLFDWGNCGEYGRIYGRTGDYSPYEYLKGGREAFRKAITEVQRQGVPVGLYIEAYLLEEKGKLGQAHGKEWQLVGANGSGLYWPKSSEMYVCSWVPAWREVQASTYAGKVSELDVSGMYLDEYGFAGSYVDCHSKTHGHPVPGSAVVGERGCTKLVRGAINRVKPGVALYSEDSPCDVTSQFQDGSFTYAMNESYHTRTQVPLNFFRFAIPSFKTFEILFCDKPTGSWATGVKWVFFNGEGIWLEGPADDWFAPQTLAAIRKCHALLRQHRDAFTSDEPVPLAPTETGGVFANLFPTATKRVYTLYNSRHRTVSGPVLRAPQVAGAKWWDGWNDKPASVRRERGFDIISTTIGPMDVGCLVQEPSV